MTLYLLVALTCLNHIAFKGSKVLVSLYAIELGASPVAIGALCSLSAVFPFMLAIYAGKVSDRFGMRLPMLAGTSGLAVALSLPYFFPGLPALYLSAALIGLFYIFHVVAMQHLVGAIGDAAARTKNYSVYSLGVATSSFVGPLLVGFSIDGLGHGNTYGLLALVPLVPLAILFSAPNFVPRLSAAVRDQSARAPGTLWANPPLRRILLVGGVIETGGELYTFYLPIYARSIGLSASAIGAIMSTYAVAALVIRGLMPALVRLSSEERVLAGALLLSAVTYLLFPFVRSPVLLTAISFMLGMGLGTCSPLSMILTYNRAPSGRSGEAMGLRQTLNKMSEASAPLVFGAIGSAVGMLPVFWGSALLLGIGAWALHYSRDKLDAPGSAR